MNESEPSLAITFTLYLKIPHMQDLDTEIVIATAREPATNATAVSANLVVDERQMNALFLDVVSC